MAKFKIGDRVTRHVALDEPRKCGTIVEVYKGKNTNSGAGPTLYSVEWDGTKYKIIGHLEIGLERE